MGSRKGTSAPRSQPDSTTPRKQKPLAKSVIAKIRESAEREVDRLHEDGIRGDEARKKLVARLKRDVHCDDHRFTRLSEVKDCQPCQQRLHEALDVGTRYLAEIERLSLLLDAAKSYVVDTYGTQEFALDDFDWMFAPVADVPAIEAYLREERPDDEVATCSLAREKDRLSDTGWLMVRRGGGSLCFFAVDADTALAVSRYRQKLWPGTYEPAGKDGAEPCNRIWTQEDEDQRLLDVAHRRLGPESDRLPLLTENRWKSITAEFLKEERERLEEIATDPATDEATRASITKGFETLAIGSEMLTKGLRVLGHSARAEWRWYFVGLDEVENAAYKRFWNKLLREERKLRAIYGEDW